MTAMARTRKASVTRSLCVVARYVDVATEAVKKRGLRPPDDETGTIPRRPVWGGLIHQFKNGPTIRRPVGNGSLRPVESVARLGMSLFPGTVDTWS